jgi:hypothetical protein
VSVRVRTIPGMPQSMFDLTDLGNISHSTHRRHGSGYQSKHTFYQHDLEPARELGRGLAGITASRIFGNPKIQARGLNGCTTPHYDGATGNPNNIWQCKRPADAMRLIVSINTTMMFFVGDTVFYWKTSVPGVPEARLLPCGLLQSTAHQAVSNDAAGVSWIITIA